MLTVPTTPIASNSGLSDLDGRTSVCLKAGMAPVIGVRRRMTAAIVTSKPVIRARPSYRSAAKNP
jgi:predicted RecB family endonuclease